MAPRAYWNCAGVRQVAKIGPVFAWWRNCVGVR